MPEFGNKNFFKAVIICFMKTMEEILQMAIGRALRNERRRRGIKFTIFCYEHDFPTTTLYMLETGNSKTSAVSTFRIAELLGLSFQEFGALVDKEVTALKKEFGL